MFRAGFKHVLEILGRCAMKEDIRLCFEAKNFEAANLLDTQGLAEYHQNGVRSILLCLFITVWAAVVGDLSFFVGVCFIAFFYFRFQDSFVVNVCYYVPKVNNIYIV